MATRSKSNNLYINSEKISDFTGMSLDSICNLIGKFSKRENFLDSHLYTCTWILPERVIKLTFTDSNTCIKVLEDSKISPNNWLKEVIKAPMFLTLFAGLVSIGVGYTWEYFKFKRQTIFEKRINLILDSRKQVQDIFIEYDRIVRQIRAYEKGYQQRNNCDPKNFEDHIEELKLLGLRVRYIQDFSKGVINNPQLKTNIQSFEDENVKYLTCLGTNIDCDICTDKFKRTLDYLNKIIELHTSEINSQIK